MFLSHYQLYGPDVMDLKGQLEARCPELRGSIWYDKDDEPSTEAMREGVRGHRYFLLYLTEGVLRRPFCRKEIRWCARRLDALEKDSGATSRCLWSCCMTRAQCF